MNCVASGAPYLLGTAVALRTMTVSARRRRLGAGVDRSEPDQPDSQPAATA